MTMKVRLIKLLEKTRSVGCPPVRRPPLKPAMLYLMELRSHSTEVCLPKRKLAVTTDLKDSLNFPHPVKITYVTPAEAQPAAVPG
jgi:hypothetical protein